MEGDEESLFLMHNIHVCLTQRSFIPHGGIQDDSFLIATQSRKPASRQFLKHNPRTPFFTGVTFQKNRATQKCSERGGYFAIKKTSFREEQSVGWVKPTIKNKNKYLVGFALLHPPYKLPIFYKEGNYMDTSSKKTTNHVRYLRSSRCVFYNVFQYSIHD